MNPLTQTEIQEYQRTTVRAPIYDQWAKLFMALTIRGPLTVGEFYDVLNNTSYYIAHDNIPFALCRMKAAGWVKKQNRYVWEADTPPLGTITQPGQSPQPSLF
jgi:hypothetical protein